MFYYLTVFELQYFTLKKQSLDLAILMSYWGLDQSVFVFKTRTVFKMPYLFMQIQF